MSSPSSTETSRSTGRRSSILAAARRLFAQRGYAGSSLRDIAREAGVSHPGLLHHFHSKEILLAAVIDEEEARVQSVIDGLDEVTGGSVRFDDVVRHAFSQQSELILLFSVLSTEAIDPTFPARLRLMRLRRVHERVFEHVLRAEQADGKLDAEMDIPACARALVNMEIAGAVREATIGSVQPATRGVVCRDVLSIMGLMRRTTREVRAEKAPALLAGVDRGAIAEAVLGGGVASRVRTA